ncbi:MAG: phosphodiester glycosidase family protein [Clostridia bacterium]|nr:phosphodiester glycosidase family protein [Clostridia bacterium]
MKRKFAVILLTLIFCISSADASILGSVITDQSSLPIGQGLTLYKNTFLSDQNGVGYQTEYYTEYSPNSDVAPVVLTGNDIYGKRDINQILEYMKENEMVPMVGINASFFSFETGIPMGHVITNGVVTSKDDRTLPGVGFRADGTGFIDDLCIVSTASFGENYLLQIPHINKLISSQTQMLTLYTPDFGEDTGSKTETLNVVLENISDNVRIGGTLTCTVAEIFKSSEPVKINANQFVLSVNTSGNQWAISLINTMTVGEEITISTTASNEKWNDAQNGLASEGKKLLTNGVAATDLEKGAAPRTAVGITEKGNIIFYVIDGRQSGYSYGAQQTTVAKRLKELGCVDALNLDGGGSTSMAGIYPGCDTSVILNSPSEGKLRKVTNFIFLQNVSKAVGKPEMAYIYPYAGKILSGSRIQLNVRTVDENYYTTSNGDVSYSCNEYGVVEDNGILEALGEGIIKVTAETEGLKATASYQSIISPESFKLYNAQNMAELNDIDVLPGDVVYFATKAKYGGVDLLVSNDAYRWTVPEGSGVSVSNDGVMRVSENFDKDTVLTVKAGSVTNTYRIRIGNSYFDAESYPYSEINISNNKLKVDMYSYNDKISTDKSYIKIDGKKVDFSECTVTEIDARHTLIEYNLADDFMNGYHKVYVETVLKNGYSSVNTYSVKNTPMQNVFADTDGHWAKDIISYMNSTGIVNGSYENDQLVYKPQNKVTRAEFAIMAANFMELDKNLYSDVSLSDFEDEYDIPKWAEDSVKAVYGSGIINGKNEGGTIYFAPSAYITRAEAVTILSRILPAKTEAKNITYADSSIIPSWSAHAFKVLSTAGLIKGYEDKTIRPLDNVTRAEAITMLYNIY